MKVTMPNPNIPGELDEMENFMSLIEDCLVRGGWRMGMLEKQLDRRVEMNEAIARLRVHLESLYPPIEIEVNMEANKEVAA